MYERKDGSHNIGYFIGVSDMQSAAGNRKNRADKMPDSSIWK